MSGCHERRRVARKGRTGCWTASCWVPLGWHGLRQAAHAVVIEAVEGTPTNLRPRPGAVHVPGFATVVIHMSSLQVPSMGSLPHISCFVQMNGAAASRVAVGVRVVPSDYSSLRSLRLSRGRSRLVTLLLCEKPGASTALPASSAVLQLLVTSRVVVRMFACQRPRRVFSYAPPSSNARTNAVCSLAYPQQLVCRPAVCTLMRRIGSLSTLLA
jgi:hypothetical protein